MIIRAGTAASFVVDLPSGVPDAGITWALLLPSGVALASGVLATPAGSVSATITIPGGDNTLPSGLSSYRDLTWTYTVNGVVTNGEARYDIEARVPFGASADGVRTKLGIDNISDLPDGEISLVRAYLSLQDGLTADVLATADPADLTVRDAIEATAALAILPSLSVRLAQTESSGTSAYQRQKIDWATLVTTLTDKVTAAYTLLAPSFDPTVLFTPLIILATPSSDPFTGDAYS